MLEGSFLKLEGTLWDILTNKTNYPEIENPCFLSETPWVLQNHVTCQVCQMIRLIYIYTYDFL